MTQKIAVYPGSFDPITLGHCDIIFRSSALFSHVIVAVVTNPPKKNYFSLEERLALVQSSVASLHCVSVLPFEGLLINFMRSQKANILIRGLRSQADLEYEFQLAHMNQHLAPKIETIFLPSKPEFAFISSSLIKEVVHYSQSNNSISDFVPAAVVSALTARGNTLKTTDSIQITGDAHGFDDYE